MTLALTAADISRIEPARLWGTRCYTRVSLTRPITGHSTLVLGTNQYWPLKQMFKGHHELREDLRRFTDQKG